MRARSLRGRRSSPRRVRIRMKAYPDVFFFFFASRFFPSPLPFFLSPLRVVVIIVVVVVAVAVAFAAAVLYNIVSLCAHEFFFSLPEAIKMMDDFPRGVPCRVVFSLSLSGSLSLFLTRSFPLPPQFSLSVPFHHDSGHRAKLGTRDATGVCFSRERLNVKQEMTAVAE